MEQYDGLEMEVLRFAAEDILTASAESSEDSCGDDSGDNGGDNGGGNEITYTLEGNMEGIGNIYLGSDGNKYILVNGEYILYSDDG